MTEGETKRALCLTLLADARYRVAVETAELRQRHVNDVADRLLVVLNKLDALGDELEPSGEFDPFYDGHTAYEG